MKQKKFYRKINSYLINLNIFPKELLGSFLMGDSPEFSQIFNFLKFWVTPQFPISPIFFPQIDCTRCSELGKDSGKDRRVGQNRNCLLPEEGFSQCSVSNHDHIIQIGKFFSCRVASHEASSHLLYSYCNTNTVKRCGKQGGKIESGNKGRKRKKRLKGD